MPKLKKNAWIAVAPETGSTGMYSSSTQNNNIVELQFLI